MERNVAPAVRQRRGLFFLNESFAAGKSILDFETLRDFDEADHQFQEQARQEDAQRQGQDYSALVGALEGMVPGLVIGGTDLDGEAVTLVVTLYRGLVVITLY